MKGLDASKVFCFVCCLTLAVTTPAFSETISGPTWDVHESPTWFRAVFESGPVDGTEPYEFTSPVPYVSPSGYWMVFNLDVYEEDRSIDGLVADGVSIDVAMQHIKGPHPGEGTGLPVEMSWDFDAGSDPDPLGISVPHAGSWPGAEWVHWDVYKGTVSLQVNPERTDILGYTITLEGAHVVPAPSALIGLAGMSLMGVLGYIGRWRMRVA